MELKTYQQQVINDLSLFLEKVQETKDMNVSFYNFWTKQPKTPLHLLPGKAIDPNKNNVQRIPPICINVQMEGGKNLLLTTYESMRCELVENELFGNSEQFIRRMKEYNVFKAEQ